MITKEPERQQAKLNMDDFKAVLLALKTLDEAFVYYNSGGEAGASQDHKHMQVIPVQSLPNSKIPIHDRVMDALQRSQVGHDQELDILDKAEQGGSENIDYGAYNNLASMANNYNSSSKQ